MSDGSPHGNGEPSRWVRHWAHLVAPGGAVLDVASGSGRHARFFASLGHPVTALDRDAAALEAMRDESRITTLAADIEGAAWPLPADAKFAGIVVTNYLHRPLFPQLLRSLAPGGVLVYETFAQGNERVGKPSNPAFLLAPGEPARGGARPSPCGRISRRISRAAAPGLRPADMRNYGGGSLRRARRGGTPALLRAWLANPLQSRFT